MTKKLPRSAFYSIKAPGNFYAGMRREVELLRDHVSYTTCTTVIMCCLDALAAGTGDASRGKFVAFAQKHFPVLCTDLDGMVLGKSGADVLYDKYRNGFAHLRGPKSGFAIAEDRELDGRYAGELEVEGMGKFVAINVDRLIKNFLQVVEGLEEARSNDRLKPAAGGVLAAD